jgi:hypothetical protein
VPPNPCETILRRFCAKFEIGRMELEKRQDRVVVCCSAEETLKPGYAIGHRCHVCDHELQVSPFGLPRVASGGLPVCNPCGFEILLRESRRCRLNLESSPAVRAHAQRTGRTPLEELRIRRHR